jgi:alkylhydroperoxidase family enzyme
LSGEKDQRIIGFKIWPEISFYSDNERAALAWTEVLTRFSKKNIKEEFYEEISSYLSNKELKVLSNAISSINNWKQQNPGEPNYRSI